MQPLQFIQIFQSHTGATWKMCTGAITTISCKHTFTTRRSTAAEVVTNDDGIGPMLCAKRFLETWGRSIQKNLMFQDNHSAMLLEANGRKSAGKRAFHLNIRLFFVTDHKENGNILL